MHPLSLLTHRARLSVLGEKYIHKLPLKEDIPSGVVAIVDISGKALSLSIYKSRQYTLMPLSLTGYTKLTDSLARMGTSERIREILNPPFELIIRTIHKCGGSIIKFAGDSVLAIWTPPPVINKHLTHLVEDEVAEKSEPVIDDLFVQCILCCCELMCLFENYKLVIPERWAGTMLMSGRAGGDSNDPNNAFATLSKDGITNRRTSAGVDILHSNWNQCAEIGRGNTITRRSVAGENPRKSEVSSPHHTHLAEDQTLRIHIGIGLGSFRHIFLGNKEQESGNTSSALPSVIYESESEPLSVRNSIVNDRVEQFVAGLAVQEAGDMLGLGKTGELAFPGHAHYYLEKILLKSPTLSKLMHENSQTNSFVIKDDFETVIDLVRTATALTNAPESSRDWLTREGSMPPSTVSFEACRKALAFMDESLHAFISSALNGIARSSSTSREPMRTTSMNGQEVKNVIKSLDNSSPLRKKTTRRRKSDAQVAQIEVPQDDALFCIQLDDYNQLRRVSIVFIQIQALPLKDIGADSNLPQLQAFMEAVTTSVRRHGGCCRQLNCDEKGLCALLVWGLEGFAHEKGEARHAISAALEIQQRLFQIFGGTFSIGVATGQVFAGVIGNELRGDGTLLGPCVNLAARIMCQKVCQSKILCDSETFKECSDDFLFNSNYSYLTLKGVQQDVQVHEPLRIQNVLTSPTDNNGHSMDNADGSKLGSQTAPGQTLSGRTNEAGIVSDAIQKWYQGERVSILIIGKSGSGKTFLVRNIIQTFKDDPSVITCFASGQENRQAAFFIFEYIIEAISNHLTANGWSTHRIRKGRRAVFSSPSHVSTGDIHSQTNISSLITTYERTLGGRRSMAMGIRGSINIEPSVVLQKIESCDILARQRTASIAGEDPLSEVLLALGEPLSTIELLRNLFPRLFGRFTHITVAPAQDVGPRLLSYISRILQTLYKLGLRTVFILDDVQWFDSGSYDIAIELGNRCPFLLPFFLSRPLEEYKDTLRSRFNQIEESRFCVKIVVDKLDGDAVGEIIKNRFSHVMGVGDKVAPSLLNEVFEKSQGNPLVVKIICGILLQDETIILDGGVLFRRGGKDLTATVLPLDSTSAVIAQFDKLSSNMKTILRIASVAGQYFHVEEVHYVLQSTESILSDTISTDEMRQLLKESDPYDLIHWNNHENRFLFSHYLIQQGIYSSLVPSRREELHHHYAEYYESTLTDENRKDNVTAIINHLLKVPNEEERKKIYLYEAFKVSVEKRRSLEAMEYFNLYNEFLLISPDLEKKTLIEQAREYRLLSQMYFENKELNKALDYFRLAMKLFGFRFPNPHKEMPKLIYTALRYCLFSLSLAKNTERRRIIRSFDLASKTFPAAFRTFDKALIRRTFRQMKHQTGKSITKMNFPQSTDANGQRVAKEMAKFQSFLEELTEMMETGLYVCYHGQASLDVPLISALLLIAHLIRMADKSSLCMQFGRAGNCLDVLGFGKASDRIHEVAAVYLPTYHETYSEIMDLCRYAETRAILYDSRGEWEKCISFYKVHLSSMDSVGDGASPIPHLSRVVDAVVRELVGDLSILRYQIEEKFLEYYAGQDDSLDVSTIKLLLAGLRSTTGDLELAKIMYTDGVKSSRKLEGHPLENGWISFYSALNQLRYESFKHYSSENAETRRGDFDIFFIKYAHTGPLYMKCFPILCEVLLDQIDFATGDYAEIVKPSTPKDIEDAAEKNLTFQIVKEVRTACMLIQKQSGLIYPKRPHFTRYFQAMAGIIMTLCDGSLTRFSEKLLIELDRFKRMYTFVSSAENHIMQLMARAFRARRVQARHSHLFIISLQEGSPHFISTKRTRKSRVATFPEEFMSPEKLMEQLRGHGLIFEAQIIADISK
ncbi:hypothetical protein HDU67_000084 [Dinochytrium kinnereticum]|nr:hypothetical protein HDU67_000084 [Dinochytrium kinnereticum]